VRARRYRLDLFALVSLRRAARHDVDAVVSMAMGFVVVGEIRARATIARGGGIRELARLRKMYGSGRWRNRKGIATIRLNDGTIRTAELHWYEAHLIGHQELKIKRFVK
jgi:hypothetical protein